MRRDGLTLAEIAMSMVIIAIVVAGVTTHFVSTSEKRNDTKYREWLYQFESTLPIWTSEKVTDLTSVFNKRSDLGHWHALWLNSGSFDVIYESVSRNNCKYIIEEHKHPYSVRFIKLDFLHTGHNSDRYNVTDGSECSDMNIIQVAYNR